MEHSKGKWEAVKSKEQTDVYEIYINNYTYNGQHTKADACLIAAAPDLLSACEDLMKTLLDAGFDPDISEVVNRAKAAIVAAKA